VDTDTFKLVANARLYQVAHWQIHWHWGSSKQVCFLGSIQHLVLVILQLFCHSVAYACCTSGSGKLVDSPLY